MAVFKLWKLTDGGVAEYRQEGSKVSMRCTADGMFDGEAPKEIHVTAPNLAAVPQPKAKPEKPAKEPKEPKAKKETKGRGK